MARPRIAALDVIPYALPFREPYVTARGRLERRELILVRLRGDDGVEGLGEAVPLALRAGGSIERIERELSESGGEIGDGLSPPARAALEMALLDLRAKRDNQPAWRALGADRAEPVLCNATLAAGLPDVVAANAVRWAEEGFATFKLKVGLPGDVGQVEAVRSALGPTARIRVDANGAWTPQQALDRLGAMEAHGLELAEQPAASLEELAVVRGQTAVPIAADESVTKASDARRADELGACQLATVKLAKVGGIEAAREISSLLPSYLSSALDGPVGIAAAAHAAQVLPAVGPAAGLAHGLATQRLFADTIATRECEVRDGLLHLPDGAGLGVEIDEAALERHRL
jgi:L-alanine-DL-glutamate epimerase-like enolase superfamily enzyme